MNLATPRMAVFQLFVFLAEFSALGIVMRYHGYRHTDDPSIHWNPDAVFLRENVWIVFTVPLLWFARSVWVERSPHFDHFSPKTMLILGAVVTLALSVFYLGAMFHPFTLRILQFTK